MTEMIDNKILELASLDDSAEKILKLKHSMCLLAAPNLVKGADVFKYSAWNNITSGNRYANNRNFLQDQLKNPNTQAFGILALDGVNLAAAAMLRSPSEFELEIIQRNEDVNTATIGIWSLFRRLGKKPSVQLLDVARVYTGPQSISAAEEELYKIVMMTGIANSNSVVYAPSYSEATPDIHNILATHSFTPDLRIEPKHGEPNFYVRRPGTAVAHPVKFS